VDMENHLDISRMYPSCDKGNHSTSKGSKTQEKFIEGLRRFKPTVFLFREKVTNHGLDLPIINRSVKYSHEFFLSVEDSDESH
jgi:hypothetical protein